MVSWKSLTAAFLLASSAVAKTSCGPGSNCPKDSPCCNAYGECGKGLHCLGGCDPRYSYKLDACMPMPACKSQVYNFNSTDGIVNQNKYLGDADKNPFSYTGDILEYSKDNSILITMKKESTGTVISSSHYVWFGKIKVTMKTSHRQGVVTDFILMSDVKDEIDYEFIGSDLDHAQSNYYFQGYTDYTNMKKADVDDTYDSFHTYEVDWTEDKIDYIIDGNTVRTVNKDDTYNETTKNYDFPQTPARLQLGIWPGGDDSQGKGTIDWAGGEIDWDSEDIKKQGYYYASIQSVEIECYDAPSSAGGNGTKSYVFTDKKGTQDKVELSGKDTKLNDDDNTGLDNPKGHTADASQVSSKTKSTKIPDASEVSKTKNGSSKTKDSSSTSTGKSGGNSGGFNQGGDDSDSDSSDSSDSGSSAKSTGSGSESASASGNSSSAPIIAVSSSLLALIAGAALVFM